MSQFKMRAIKQKLLAERKRAMELLRRNASTLAVVDDTTRDAGDLASASHDRDVLFLLQDSDARRLRMIDEVLHRIEKNSYGLCEECEQPITKARLEAIPWTTTCVECQEIEDARHTRAPELYVDAMEYDAA